MTSIIRKIRSRSRSKSRETKNDDFNKQVSSPVAEVSKRQSAQPYWRSSADSGVSSTHDPQMNRSSTDENMLSDEHDSPGFEISGTLAFAENASSPTLSSNFKDFPYELPWDGNYSTAINVTFEVISADVVKDGRSSHVIYSVLIRPYRDDFKKNPTVVKRRYSDFENLHHVLRKRFPSIMSNISFPKKMLIGNFSNETIAQRSTAFEQYLSHLFSHFEVRYSHEYMEFFVQDNFLNGIHHFMKREYSQAVPFFEKTIPVLEKLYGPFHQWVIQCVCSLVVCFTKLNFPNAAHSCAEMMLKCCIPESSSANDELRCASLVAAIHLAWMLGKDKVALEEKLEEIRLRGFDVEGADDLEHVLRSIFNTVMLKT